MFTCLLLDTSSGSAEKGATLVMTVAADPKSASASMPPTSEKNEGICMKIVGFFTGGWVGPKISLKIFTF